MALDTKELSLILCPREYCMDLVSLETQEENDYFQNWLAARNPSPHHYATIFVGC